MGEEDSRGWEVRWPKEVEEGEARCGEVGGRWGDGWRRCMTCTFSFALRLKGWS